MELDTLAQLEAPRGLVLELPLGGEPGVELAVRMPARQVVEEVEGHPDVVRRGAEVRVELGDVAAWAVTSSFFWVVWATAVPPAVSGTVAAAPRAAAPLSRSRRVNSIVVVPPRVRAGRQGSVWIPRRATEAARGASFIGVSPHPVKPGRRWRRCAKHDRIQRHEPLGGHRHHRRRRERHEHRVSPGLHGREERPPAGAPPPGGRGHRQVGRPRAHALHQRARVAPRHREPQDLPRLRLHRGRRLRLRSAGLPPDRGARLRGRPAPQPRPPAGTGGGHSRGLARRHPRALPRVPCGRHRRRRLGARLRLRRSERHRVRLREPPRSAWASPSRLAATSPGS